MAGRELYKSPSNFKRRSVIFFFRHFSFFLGRQYRGHHCLIIYRHQDMHLLVDRATFSVPFKPAAEIIGRLDFLFSVFDGQRPTGRFASGLLGWLYGPEYIYIYIQ